MRFLAKSFIVSRILFFCVLLFPLNTISQAHDGASDWPQYGGSDSGTRYSNHSQINLKNIKSLEVAWTYRTGELDRRSAEMNINSSNENTPIIADGKLIVCTPFNRIIALNPVTGEEKWVFDPNVSTGLKLPFQYVCRGISQWVDKKGIEETHCKHRLFIPVNDLRVIAIDAGDGKLCKDFGNNGAVHIEQSRPAAFEGEIRLNSPVAVVNNVIVVGSTIVDGYRADAPFGTVKAFDAKTGKKVWEFDPIPKELNVGGGNVWTAMAVDERRDLVYLPTSSPSPDFYGGLRPGDNRWANSLVALKASSGELVWAQQLVRHDIWDYDLPSQPTLLEVNVNGIQIPAVIQTTKQGYVFTFNRETGEPIFPLNEIDIPVTSISDDNSVKTQPIPSKPPQLVPDRLNPKDAFGFTPIDYIACRRKISKYRSEGTFTPISEQGTIFYPSTAGGANWGGNSFDHKRRMLFVNTSRVAQVITMIPKADKDSTQTLSLTSKDDISPQNGTPYTVKREWLLSPFGAPCSPPPWGGLTAINVDSGEIVWDVPLGSIRDKLPIPLPINTNLGTPNIGGPIATRSGLIFIAAAQDNYLRAFDASNGKELWKDKLPAGGQTTPMTYMAGGKQHVVITSGQHLWFQTPPGDYVVAYALPDDLNLDN